MRTKTSFSSVGKMEKDPETEEKTEDIGAIQRGKAYQNLEKGKNSPRRRFFKPRDGGEMGYHLDQSHYMDW